MIDSFPLQWPTGWPRTQDIYRKRAKFSKGERVYSSQPGGSSWTRHRDLTIADAVDRVLTELRTFGVLEGDAIISSNLRTRLDGLPYSNQKEPDDPGIAVYWRLPHEDQMKVMAIDLYDRVADNLAAVAATLNAMRAIERHGGAQILERAFTGFTALPAPGDAKSWRDILDVPDEPGYDQLARARMHYRALASANHPDRGGSTSKMAEINRAWDEAQKELS